MRETMMDMTEIIGKFVLTANGRQLGEVEGLTVDTDTWKVDQVSVKLLRSVLDDLKLKKPLLRTQTISLPTKVVSGVSDTVVLCAAVDTLEFAGGDEQSCDDEGAESGDDESDDDSSGETDDDPSPEDSD